MNLVFLKCMTILTPLESDLTPGGHSPNHPKDRKPITGWLRIHLPDVLKTRLISILMGAKLQLLEVVTGHSQFLSHFSIPQAMPAQPVKANRANGRTCSCECAVHRRAADGVPELQQACACHCMGCCAQWRDADGGPSVRADDDTHGAALAR